LFLASNGLACISHVTSRPHGAQGYNTGQDSINIVLTVLICTSAFTGLSSDVA